MKDLQLSGGDLLVGSRGFATVTGAPYLRQRIALALGEPYGDDPYHPQWGSTIPAMIGAPLLAGTPDLVTSEAARVLQQLMDAQQQQTVSAVLSGTRSQLTAADVIASVDSVSAGQSADPETVQLAIALTTQAGTQIQVSRTVTAGA